MKHGTVGIKIFECLFKKAQCATGHGGNGNCSLTSLQQSGCVTQILAIDTPIIYSHDGNFESAIALFLSILKNLLEILL